VVFDEAGVLCLRRSNGDDQAMLLLSFAPDVVAVAPPMTPGTWRRVLDSSEQRWRGPGSSLPDRIDDSISIRLRLNPGSVVVYRREEV
jgi:maltooligosyltrehalose trehalohydrolase